MTWDVYGYGDFSVTPNYIRDHAFYNLKTLKTLNITEKITQIDAPVCLQCSSLTDFKIVGAITRKSSSFSVDNGVLFNNDMAVLKKYPEGKTATTYKVPETVTSLSKCAFAYTKLYYIEFQGAAPSASDDVFTGSDALRAICYPQGKAGWPEYWKGVRTYARPNAIAGLSATRGTGDITLTWTRNDVAQSYVVYRSTSKTWNNNIPSLATVSSGSTIYTDTTAIAGDKYYYWVVAKNGDFEGLRCSPVEGWKMDYVITYRKGAYGSGESPQREGKMRGVGVVLEDALFTRTGYTQTGWATGDGGAKAYDLGAVYTTDADVTLYPFWTGNIYNVKLDQQNGSGGTASVTATFGSAMPTITVPTRTGYIFGGYYLSALEGGTQYYNADGTSARTWDKTVNKTLYAKWISTAVTITFDMQNGSDGTASVVATYDSAMPAITVPKRTGYTFGGYWTEPDGSGTRYYTATGASAQKWDKLSETTLYAKWTLNTYTVTLSRQSGSGGTASVKVSYGDTMPAIAVPTRTGYTFGGYYTETGGNGTQYYTAIGASAHNWDKTSATTLYAKWTANTYTVTLDMQGGSGGTASVVATYDSAMPAITVPTLAGYIFGGYYTAAAGSGTQYYTDAGLSARAWNKTSAETLCAKWTAIYTVTYNPGANGIGMQQTATKTHGVTLKLNGAIFTREGYTQTGWATSDGGEKVYNLSASYTANAAVSLYPFWTVNTYKVTLNRQSGSGGTASVTVTYESAMPAITLPTRTGYTFGGYYTEPDGKGTQYYKADGVSVLDWYVTSAMTLYAKWTVNSYLVIFDMQDGGGGTPKVVATYDSAMPTVTVPTRTGYTFGGYYTAAAGSGTQYYTADGISARVWNKTSATTLYAKWIANTYTVTFEKQNGSGGAVSVTATFGSAMPSITAPKRTGYTFDGYFTEPDGNGIQYYTAAGKSARMWDKTSSTILCAKWTVNTYKVTLNQQNGSGGTASVMATYDSAMPTISVPTRQGYTFGGYYTSTAGRGTQYYTSFGIGTRNWDKASTATLYAKWVAGEVTNVVFPDLASLAATFGDGSAIVKNIVDVEMLATFNAFLYDCGITAAEQLTEEQKRWAYQSFMLSEVVVAPELYTAEPIMRIIDFKPEGDSFSITVKLTAGERDVAMMATQVAANIRVGTELNMLSNMPEIVAAPDADGASLTYMIKFPGGNKGFLRVTW